MKEEKTYRQEAVVPDRGLPFKLFRFEGADGKYIREAHQHCSVEIFAVREGKADAYLGDKKYVLSAGEFMIVNSNEVHSIHTSGRNEAIVLQIPMEKQIMRFSGEKREEDQKLFALLEKMYRQQIRKEYGYELLMQSIFYQLKYLLLTVYQMSDERKEHCTETGKWDALERSPDICRNTMRKKFRWKRWQQRLGIVPLIYLKCSAGMAGSTIKIICGVSGLNMHCGNWRKRISP